METRLFQHLICYLYLLSEIIKVTEAQTEEDKPKTDGRNNKPKRPINLQSLSFEEKKKFKDSFDTIFTDCDGVLYDHIGAINNAHETVKELIKEGKTIRYVTNSSKRSKAQILQKLRNSGFDSATEETVYCPMGMVADYIQDKLSPGKSVYVVGTEEVCEALREAKIHCFGPGEDKMSAEMYKDISKVDLDLPNNVGAVIVGFDVHINYLKILKAFRFLSDKECLYIVLTPGETIGLQSSERFPAGGALAASITLASGRKPFILGKPGPFLIDILKSKVTDPERVLFIGDKLDTDVITGNKCSFKTLFVLSGSHNLGMVEKYAASMDPEDEMYIPDFYTDSFSDLVSK